MKRVTTIIASLFMCSFIFTVSAQKNFMEGWDGGDAVDAGSEPNPDFDSLNSNFP